MNAPTKRSDAQTADLLRDFAAVLRELWARGVVRSYNNPVADMAEWIGAQAFGLTLETASSKGYDAIDSSGRRYQIKSRRITSENLSTQLGVMRDLADVHFDYLLAVYFTEDFAVKAAYRVEHGAVVDHALFSRAQRGHILHAMELTRFDGHRTSPTLGAEVFNDQITRQGQGVDTPRAASV